MDFREYTYTLEEAYRWKVWACAKGEDGKIDIKNALTGKDLVDFVNEKLFPYLRNFKDGSNNEQTIEYKIGAVFEVITNRIQDGGNLREVLNIVDGLEFQNNDDLFELSKVYENLLQGMGSDGGNSGEFYTPRPLIKAMVEAIQPKIENRIYDPSCGTCGFLIESYEFIKSQNTKDGALALSSEQIRFLNTEALSGIEKTPLSYAMGLMNMILHGIEAPHISKANTLNKDIRQIQESQRFDIVLSAINEDGKITGSFLSNFQYQSNAVELLYLQHILKSVKNGGKIGIVIRESILINLNKAYYKVKESMLTDFRIEAIVSLPAGVFLPYSGVKTNFIILSKTGKTQDIWYYEVNPPYKLTKNKPIQYEHFKEFLALYPSKTLSENSWKVNVNDIQNTDLSAKNPNKQAQAAIESSAILFKMIEEDNLKITGLVSRLRGILN